MLYGVIDKPTVSRLAQASRLLHGTTLFAALCLLSSLGLAAAWAHAWTGIPNLGNPQHLQRSGLNADWAKGSVIVVLRHAERCDRSEGACLGDPAGITVAGNQVAANVGRGLQHLGLEAADVWASPQVRTRQTAQAMFGNPVATQDWLDQCDGHFAENTFARKRRGHNLVLVSHSSCMEQLEQALEVPAYATSNHYASALFISQGSDGKARLLGQLDASEWRKTLDAKAH